MKQRTRKVLGFAILGNVFAGIFAFQVVVDGFWVAMGIFSGSIVLTAIIALAMYLLTTKGD